MNLSYANETNQTFELTTINDQNISVIITENTIKLEKNNDKVVFLLFFGHNCKPCLKEIPLLKKLMNKKHKDLTLLATDIHGYNKEDLTKFKKEHKINYPLLTREDNKMFIKFIKVKSKWRGALPFLLVLNKKGEVKLAHRGALNLKKFEKIYQIMQK
jgi:thiol-disulfide isomerase/thioredoxin